MNYLNGSSNEALELLHALGLPRDVENIASATLQFKPERYVVMNVITYNIDADIEKVRRFKLIAEEQTDD